MERIIYNDITYNNLYRQNNEDILKISTIPIKIWKRFCDKKLKFVNTPTSYHRISKKEERLYNVKPGIINKKSVITLPFLTGYTTLNNTVFDSSFTTTQILELLKKTMAIIQYIHQNQVTHNDLHPDNIMINKNHDIQLIDFESMTIDDYIAEENSFFDDECSDEEKIKQSIHEDKLDILIIYFSYLCSGNFKSTSKFYKYLEPQNHSHFGLKKAHMDALIDFFIEETKDNYYYMDFIDELITEGYQAPVVYSKNIFHQHNNN